MYHDTSAYIPYLEKEIQKTKKLASKIKDAQEFAHYTERLIKLEADILSFKADQKSRVTNINIPDRLFTLEELQTNYNGRNGTPCYVALQGIVFDVSRIAPWAGGNHLGLSCGNDLTSAAIQCGYHNPKDIMKKMPAVGRLAENASDSITLAEAATYSSNIREVNNNKITSKAETLPINNKSICSNRKKCFLNDSKSHLPLNYIRLAIDRINEGSVQKPNCIWLETSGCFGEIISLLDGENPNLVSLLTDMVNMTFFNSIMGDSGEAAFEKILETIHSDIPYILIVSGAIPLRSDGRYAIIARYKEKPITALEAVKLTAPKASYIIAGGTCASFGGPTAARPNVSEGVTLKEVIDMPVINVPGCPIHPLWILGTIAHIVNFGMPELDNLNTPTTFYGVTIHDRCPRRAFFDAGIFASAFGQPQCMFRLGCRGPITKTLCPFNRWNTSNNWPIGDNTTCIGCASFGFPDLTEPFVRY